MKNPIKIIYFYIQGDRGWLPANNTKGFYFAAWSGLLASYISRLTTTYSFINVRQEFRVDTPLEKIIDNVQIILYPQQKHLILGFWSRKLVERVMNLTKENISILHIFHTHCLISYVLVFLFRKHPIVLTNYGHTPPSVLLCTSHSVWKKSKLFLLNLLEGYTYRFVDAFSPSGIYDRIYMQNRFPNILVSDFDHLGIDLELFNPIDELVARRRLGLPEDAKILIYTGHLYTMKGVDHILKSYNDLKAIFCNIQLILIGAHHKDTLYEDAINSGAIVLGRISQEDLYIYYSASNVYLLPNFNSPNFVKYGGIGTAPLEALACNTPVISTHLIHLPTKELNRVGIIPQSPADLTEAIKFILENPKQYSNCRDIIIRYYEREKIANKLICIYDELSNKYFEQRNATRQSKR